MSERRERLNEKKYQPQPDKEKSLESAQYIISHCNFNINDVFSNEFSSWKDTWILDLGPKYHITFRRDLF